jgi:putative transposase
MRKRHTQLAFTGSIHFITTVTGIRGNWFIEPSVCEGLLSIFESYRAKFAIECLGYVLMPDHIHGLLVQKEEGLIIPAFMEGFKSLTARLCRLPNYTAPALWRARYDDVPVPGSDAVRIKLEYIHNNPVRRGLVELPECYRWSSAGDYWDGGSGIVKVEKELSL